MITTTELLGLLDERGVKNHQIAKALGVSPSRVTEIRKGERVVKLDEAAKLVAAFGLEEPQSEKMPALPAPIARLMVQYIVSEVAPQAPPHRIVGLAADIAAFAEFVTDPAVRQSIEAAEHFFRAMRLRHPVPEEAAAPGSDPVQAR